MRCAPGNIYEVIKVMNEKEKKQIEEIGFGSLLTTKIISIPGRLAYWLVMNYDPDLNELNMGSRIGKMTPQLVHEAFGIPIGEETVVEKNRPRLGSSICADMFLK